MAFRKKLKGVVHYLKGAVLDKNGDSYNTQQEAWRAEAKCGCGIDCCYGALVLKDQETLEATYLYVSGGEVLTTTDPKADLKKIG